MALRRGRRALTAAVVLAGCGLNPVAAGAQTVGGLSSVQLFAAADSARTAGRTDDALAIYDALSHDPDIEIRTEARFREGLLLADLKRYADAAVRFRALLDEKPDAARVRIELARVLAAMGNESAARRALRQAQAGALPDDVALAVEQFANALRSRKRIGGSFELALAPDSNVNRATAARTLDTVIAPLTLSDDARAKSGLGVRVGGQGYGRVDIGRNLSLLPRASVRANLYRDTEFDDVSASALAGLEWRSGADRITPSIGPTWRWYGGSLYATTVALAFDVVHPLGRRAQMTVSASAARARYRLNDPQDGGLYDLGVTLERALGRRGGAGLSLAANRQTARDPGYATVSGGLTAFGWREAGRISLFASGGFRRLVGDERLILFQDPRREWLLQASGGATFRQLTVLGFAPILRVSWERNRSSVGLYDYRRLTGDIGITRAF